MLEPCGGPMLGGTVLWAFWGDGTAVSPTLGLALQAFFWENGQDNTPPHPISAAEFGPIRRMVGICSPNGGGCQEFCQEFCTWAAVWKPKVRGPGSRPLTQKCAVSSTVCSLLPLPTHSALWALFMSHMCRAISPLHRCLHCCPHALFPQDVHSLMWCHRMQVCFVLWVAPQIGPEPTFNVHTGLTQIEVQF